MVLFVCVEVGNAGFVSANTALYHSSRSCPVKDICHSLLKGKISTSRRRPVVAGDGQTEVSLAECGFDGPRQGEV